MDAVLRSLRSYFGDKGIHALSRRWIEEYRSFGSVQRALDRFEMIFQETPAIFGINEHNVYDVQNRLARYCCHNEAFIKSSFVKNVLRRKQGVAGFELPVLDNRLDLCFINKQHSYAFEIKTALDSLTRLPKQLESYLKTFEFVYVVCDNDKLNEILRIVPGEVGVYAYDDRPEKTRFELVRLAVLSSRLDFEAQTQSFPSYLSAYRPDRINRHFKDCVVKKYKEQWGFLLNNIERIKMLDYQASFKLCRIG